MCRLWRCNRSHSTNGLRARRPAIVKPSLALVSIVFWFLPMFFLLVAVKNKNPIAGLIGICFGLLALGWSGAERRFFRDRRDGTNVTLHQLLALVPCFSGRFLRLGILVGIVTAPIVAIAIVTSARLVSLGMARSAAAALHIEMVTTMVAVDLALTFVTSALVFTTDSAVEALRIGLRMIRQTWPRSGLYVLCPPLALNMLNAMYVRHLPVVTLVAAVGLVVLALMAKGATAAFYLRERPRLSGGGGLSPCLIRRARSGCAPVSTTGRCRLPLSG